jgi:soluble lytic murein transglycosylase-like protein
MRLPAFLDLVRPFVRPHRTPVVFFLILFSAISVWPTEVRALDIFEAAKSWVKTLKVFNTNPEKCDDPPPGAATNAAKLPPRKMDPPAPPPKPAAPLLYKSDSELRQYFKCYVDNPEHIKETLSNYLPLINAAAKAYDIPPTLLGCLLFRESMFRKEARSRTGALGLSQQVPKNLRYLSNVLNSRSEAEAEEIEATASRTPEEQVKARRNKISLAVARSEVQQAVSKRKSLRLMKRWEAYFGELQKKQLVHAGPIPRQLTSTNIIEDPAIAIGAGALYLRDILITFRTTFDSRVEVDQAGRASDPDLLLAAAGAYNLGAGGERKQQDGQVKRSGAYQYIYPVLGQGYASWVKALTESNEETSAHILSIKNCMQPSTPGTSLEGWAPPIGTAPRDCRNPVDGKYETLPGKRPLGLPKEIQDALKMNNAPASAASATVPQSRNQPQQSKKKSKKSGVKP